MAWTDLSDVSQASRTNWTLNPKTPTVESCGSCIASCKALAKFGPCGATKETYGKMFLYVVLRRTCFTDPDSLCFQEMKDSQDALWCQYLRLALGAAKLRCRPMQMRQGRPGQKNMIKYAQQRNAEKTPWNQTKKSLWTHWKATLSQPIPGAKCRDRPTM